MYLSCAPLRYNKICLLILKKQTNEAPLSIGDIQKFSSMAKTLVTLHNDRISVEYYPHNQTMD